MGSCQNQFQNIEPDVSVIQEEQRIENTVINNEHYSIRIQNQSPSIGKNSIIDRQILHSTIIHRYENTIVAAKSNQKQSQQLQEVIYPHLEELNYNFYYSLGLEEYQYKQFPKQQYINVVTSDQTDQYGVKYIGEWKQTNAGKELHGNGVLISNTFKYIGQFKNGLKHYHGREIFANQVYEGQFQAGRRKGEGVRYTAQITEYGKFDRDIIEGKISYTNGDSYKGTLKNGKYDGKNNLFYDSGADTTYSQATFVLGVLTWAKVSYSNGNRYEGAILKKCKHGKGKYFWPDGSYYDGEYCWDQKHGRGILKNGTYPPVSVEFKHGQLVDGILNQSSDLRSQLPSEWRD